MWGDLVGVLSAIPKESFLEVNPAPFLLELPETESARDLPLLPPSLRERRKLIEKRLRILADEDLRQAGTHYLATKTTIGPATQAKIVVGRKQGADVVISINTVSKFHAELGRSTRGWTVSDLDTANGTFLEGRRLPAGRSLPIKSGMVVEFSSYRAVFLDPGDAHDLMLAGGQVPLDVREILAPVPGGRPLRDVVAVLGDADLSALTSASAFLVQVPTELEEDILDEPDPAESPRDSTLTQEISRTRIMRLQRSRKVGDALVHVILPTKSGVTLGRDAKTADLVLPESSVSKEHARILFDRSWGIVDLDTRNGTFLEGKRIPAGIRHDLKPGQGVFFSGYRVLFLELTHLLQLVSKVQGKI